MFVSSWKVCSLEVKKTYSKVFKDAEIGENKLVFFSGLTMIFPLQSGWFMEGDIFPMASWISSKYWSALINGSKSCVTWPKIVLIFKAFIYQSFCSLSFCSVRSENIMISPNNSILVRHPPQTGLFQDLSYFGMRF